MSLAHLGIQGVRNLKDLTLTPAPGVNCLWGSNGAGKTSVLEAIFMLGRGRSFRTASLPAVIQHGESLLRVTARRGDNDTRLGIERGRDHWRGRINGQDSQRISEFAAALPLVLIEPDSHRLVDGGPDGRRQYMDWQLFHVEPDYLALWQRYSRLLRQRNMALKQRASTAVLVALEGPMAAAAEQINQWRQREAIATGERVLSLIAELELTLPADIQIRYRPGHPADKSLMEAWAEQREADRERGFTQRGPHRADLVLTCSGRPAAMEMSRGQQKLMALCLLLGQLLSLQHHSQQAPLLLLDDPVSELDARHLGLLYDWIAERPFQTWMTMTAPPERSFSLFHVEHGALLAG